MLVLFLDALDDRADFLHLLSGADALQFQREHRQVDKDGQGNDRPAPVVSRVVIEVAQSDKQRFSDHGEPPEIHQAVERRLFRAQHIQVLGGDEEPEIERLWLSCPQHGLEWLRRLLFLPLRRIPHAAPDAEDVFGRVGKEDTDEESILESGHLDRSGDQAGFLDLGLRHGSEIAGAAVDGPS